MLAKKRVNIAVKVITGSRQSPQGGFQMMGRVQQSRPQPIPQKVHFGIAGVLDPAQA
jgi:hypothetical protein